MDDDTQDKLIDLYTQYGDQLTQPRLRCGASTATTVRRHVGRPVTWQFAVAKL